MGKTGTIVTGTYGNRYKYIDQTVGTNVVLSLIDGADDTFPGGLHIGLTPEGRKELLELKQADHIKRIKAYVDEEILFELMGDEFFGNGWSFTPTLDSWGQMTDAPGISDDFTIEDNGDKTFNRVWFQHDYALYPTLLEKLVANDLIFTWGGPLGIHALPTRLY